MNKKKMKRNINLEVVWAVKTCFLLCIARCQRALVLVFFSAKMNRQVENRFDFLCFTTGSRNRKVETLLKFSQIFEAAQCFFLTLKKNINISPK